MNQENNQNGISRELLKTILDQYVLSWQGIHGIAHWARVLTNGRHLADLTGANLAVVELFAVFHDARRETDGVDYRHGREGAELAASLRGSLVNLDAHSFDLLYYACAYHTDGLTEADITIQACWDSDRLDLWRVQITPREDRLCTGAATDPILFAQAEKRSRDHQTPSLVYSEWGIDIPSNGKGDGKKLN